MNYLYAGVGIVTLATLLLELLLTRIFSVTLSYHFAFMVISLALFGLGLSGVVLYLRAERFTKERLGQELRRHAIGFAITLLLLLVYVVNHGISSTTDVLQVSKFTWQSFFQLTFIYCFAAVPFYYGGMVVSLALFHCREHIARLYFFDLLGASLACLLLDPLLALCGAPNAVLLVAVLVAFAAILFGGVGERFRLSRPALATAIGLVLLMGLNLRYSVIELGDFKEVKNERLLFAKWNAFSRIEVQQEPSQPNMRILTIDSLARTDIIRLPANAFDGPPPSTPGNITELAHAVNRPGNVLIIGPGGGVDVRAALRYKHKRIVLAEINPIILFDLMLGRFKEFSRDLYARPEVEPNLAEGRSFVRRSHERFSMIQATLVDTWAATAGGAFALTENHLYTVEAFEDYLAHLKPDGVLTMSRWVGTPGMEFVRLTSLARAALERQGVTHPAAHIFAASGANFGTLVVRRTPFSAADLDRLHAAAEHNGYEVLHSPRGSRLNPLSLVATSTDLASFYRQFPVDVRPVYDERPFFFFAVKPEKVLSSLLSTDGPMELNTRGTVILAALLLIVFVLVLGALVVPLWLCERGALKGATGSKLRDLGYFVAIGIGFILIEIGLLHRFTLFLGHPIHSLRAVLFGLLLSSGVGSLWSGRVVDPLRLRQRLILTGLLVPVLIVGYVLALPPLLSWSMGFGLLWRALLAALLIAPCGLLMGTMLPSGMRLLSRRHAAIIPWAWGLNGAASVLGTVLAMSTSIFAGFTTTLIAGASLYVCAVLLGARKVIAAETDAARTLRHAA